MKRIAVVLLVVMAAGALNAAQYEAPMLSMEVPSGLEQGQMYFVLNHRFMQNLTTYPSDDLYALLDNGVNMGLCLRYLAVAGLEINAGYMTRNREQSVGISYVLKFPEFFFNMQAGVQFFTYVDYVHNNFDQNMFYTLSFQSEPLLDDRLYVSLDAAYDGYAENPGLAVGASFEVLSDISLIAEYYPVFKVRPDNDSVGTTGIYYLGLKIQTSGHQFKFKFGNSPDIGMRRMMLGTDSLDLYAGFEIMRLIRF